MYGVLNLDKIKNELHSLLVNCEMQGRTGKFGGPVRNYELGPSAVAAVC